MNNKTKIIFDTDIGGDCDDAGALALLHRLCNKGEASLLAVTHCYSSPYVAGCIDAINRFYGRVVPVGINYDISTTDRGVYAGELCDKFPNSYPSENYGTPKAAPDTLQVLRETLAKADDGSVTLVVTGTLASMAKLISSKPDDISPLSGKELVAKKICRTVVMGGRFFESWPMPVYPYCVPDGAPVEKEWNIKGSGIWAAQTVCNEWHGEIVFSSYEIGSYIETMVDYPKRAPKGDPVAHAYMVHNGGRGRASWDHTAILEAVRPGTYWNYHEYGKVSVDENFVTSWSRNESYKHTYLLPKSDYNDIRDVIDNILDEPNM